MISKLIFGYKKPTEQYVLRPSCYAIIFNSTSSKIAVIQKETATFYGGGIEGTETKDECLHRELLEELGWKLKLISISVMQCDIFAEKKILII